MERARGWTSEGLHLGAGRRGSQQSSLEKIISGGILVIKKEQNNAICSNLAIVTLNEVSQTQKDKYYMHMISLINGIFF